MYKLERVGAGRRVAMNTAVNAEYEEGLKMDYMKEAKEMARKLAINYLEEPMEISLDLLYNSPDNYGMTNHSMTKTYTTMERLRNVFGDIPELKVAGLKHVVTCDNTLIQFSGYTRETGLWWSVAERRIAAV